MTEESGEENRRAGGLYPVDGAVELGEERNTVSVHVLLQEGAGHVVKLSLVVAAWSMWRR